MPLSSPLALPEWRRHAEPRRLGRAYGGGMTGASQMDRRFTQVEFGGQKVQVPEGGYYDRFRMNPDLHEVARDPVGGDIDFFRRIPKQMVSTRFGSALAPNSYYRSGSVQLLFLAPLARLRAILPMRLEPLAALPGHGQVALTFFSYAVCDNDPYNEVSIAVVLRRHGGPMSQLLDGLGAGAVLRLDVVKDAQLVQNIPRRMRAFDAPGR